MNRGCASTAALSGWEPIKQHEKRPQYTPKLQDNILDRSLVPDDELDDNDE